MRSEGVSVRSECVSVRSECVSVRSEDVRSDGVSVEVSVRV